MSVQQGHIFGFHAVKAALAQLDARDTAEATLLLQRHHRPLNQRMEQIQRLARKKHIQLRWLSRPELDKLCGGNHQGMILLLPDKSSSISPGSEKELQHILDEKQVYFFLILDGVQDPHNLGACMRSADACGIDAVIIPKDKSVSLTATVIKVACGAAQYVPLIQVTNIARTIKLLQSYHIRVIGTASEASQSLYDADLSGNIALVMGSEEKGLRRLTREKCDLLVKIPMCGHVESLNLSVASGVCLFEIFRQQQRITND